LWLSPAAGIIATLRANEFIASGPRTPQPGAP
jgi:chromosome segregation and condensation protein ScpB